MEYLYILSAYLLGSVPFGLLFARTTGVDVRRAGSGNIGATNVSRLLGKRLGILTLLADTAKGALPPLGACWLFAGHPRLELVMVLAGGAAFVGHLFPVYLGFKGGKGVATALGVFLVLAPMAVAGAALLFIVAVALSGYVSLGSILAALLLPGITWFLGASSARTGLALFVALLVWIRHGGNINRLLRGQEKSWKKKGEA